MIGAADDTLIMIWLEAGALFSAYIIALCLWLKFCDRKKPKDTMKRVYEKKTVPDWLDKWKEK